jgi:hypothetical protein
VIAVCAICYGAGLIMCTRAGIFYFNIFDDYTASFSMMLLVILELVLVAHIYGLVEFGPKGNLLKGMSTFGDGQHPSLFPIVDKGHNSNLPK